MKKLSIITICYNDYGIQKTCESIVNQTWQDFEWIVIDGGSDKPILDIIENYKSRIDKFVSEPDDGIYNACNKGIRLAEGEWINFINAGDSYYSSNILEKIFINTYNEDILYGEQCEIYKNSGKCSVTNLPDNINNEFFIISNIHTPATFVKSYLFREYGLFDENLKIASDFEKWVVFLKNGKNFKYLNMIIANFDKNGISSNKKFAQLHQNERKKVIKKYFSATEIEDICGKCKKLSFLEQIFSLTNSCGKTYKIITIMGIHFKIRRKLSA